MFFILEAYGNGSFAHWRVRCFFRLKKANIGYECMFEEVPIDIKNSHLMSVLMWELEEKSTVVDKHELLSLSNRSELIIVMCIF